MSELRILTWQRELLDRLERAVGRTLAVGDAACLTWNRDRKTLTVAADPLLAELRARNSISNVFRGGYRAYRTATVPPPSAPRRAPAAPVVRNTKTHPRTTPERHVDELIENGERLLDSGDELLSELNRRLAGMAARDEATGR